MLRSIRKLIARVIASNRFTRGLFLRVALDEKLLIFLLESEIIRYRLDENSLVRQRIKELAGGLRTLSSSVSPESLYVEPGMNTLYDILSNPRTLDVICSNRILLRQVIRNPREQMAIADEIAQYGPVFMETLCSAAGQKSLENYLKSRSNSVEANELAQHLTTILLENGVLFMAINSDEYICESVKKLTDQRLN